MNKTLSRAVMTACILIASSAFADDAATPAPAAPVPAPVPAPIPGVQYNFSATAASNYIFRGISQTDNNPALFVKGQASYDGFYAGIGSENVDFNNHSEAEYDLSAGWKPTLDNFNFDLGIIRYGYTDQPDHVDADTVDFKGVVSHDFGPATVGAAVYYTPDYFGTHDDGEYYQVNAAYKIIDNLSASAAVGRQIIAAGGDYSTWNVGCDYTIVKNVALDLRYYDTNEHQLANVYQSHFVAAITTSF